MRAQDDGPPDAAAKPAESGVKADEARSPSPAGPGRKNTAALAAALRANLARRKQSARARRDAERNGDSED
jgi:hypothetical protein